VTPLRRSAEVCLPVAIAVSGFLAQMLSAQVAVTTYHYDNNRTGWDQHESVLTPANVASSKFGLLTTVTLDDQVDAQPLYVPGANITAGNFKGTQNVVYVVTENDTVYAINADSGAVLLSQNLGAPVVFPLGCNNNGPNVGITSTPVIDTSNNTLYLIAYTQDSTGPAYRLHALDLGSLADTMTPQLVSATHMLSDGTTFDFNATYQRQRPALLEANGNIYAGFGSFCDFDANVSRGWLLGWNASTLAPLSTNQVFNTLANSPDSFFLSSIWMSGYGPAADDEGNILFVTGNSDYSGTTYNGVTNIQESTIKVSSDLTTVLDLFTPSDQASLDEGDTDFGSGGALVLPDQPGPVPHLVVAAGKDGNMYFMDEDKLGGYSPNANHVLGTYQIGGCWCGQSYYVDPGDGMGRVVSSGGNQVMVWKIESFPRPGLVLLAQAPTIPGEQNPGFFTTISSNGEANPIIWALSHPNSQTSNAIGLYAFNPETAHNMTALFHGIAGNWPNFGGNSNLVPLVANGKVYVGSNKQLRIFGLKK